MKTKKQKEKHKLKVIVWGQVARDEERERKGFCL